MGKNVVGLETCQSKVIILKGVLKGKILAAENPPGAFVQRTAKLH
jgi:hypothetical protein